MFKPRAIFYEEGIEEYVLGKELLNKFSDVPKVVIENHNSIKEMQEKENREFLEMKTNLIIGTRKTHKFVPNHKISDFLVPYTSSRVYCFLYVLLFGVQL